jgi:hypothetical protein
MDKDVGENAHNKKAGRQERNLSFSIGFKEIVHVDISRGL